MTYSVQNKTSLITAGVVTTSLLFTLLSGNIAYAVNTKVIICHATGSASNPYSKEPVNDDAIDGNGNGNSDHNRSDHQNGEDIIPPGSWDADGRNWTVQNQAIWNNNCNIPTVTPTVTSTPTPTVTMTPTITVTPTVTNTPTPTTGGSNQTSTTVTPTASPSATLTPTTTPTPTSGSTNSTNSTSSEPVKTVESIQATMGTSTMASTGTFMTTVMNSLFMLGSAVTGLGVLSHRTDKKKKK